MNYYSEDIINELVDNCNVEDIIEKIEEFKDDVKMLFYYFSFYEISFDYIDALLKDEKNKYVFRCIDNSTFDIRNCPSAMVYRKYVNKEKKEITYYILMICTKQRFKKLGYASALLDDFIKRVKKVSSKNSSDYKVKIALSSLDNVVSYYEHYGFKMKSNNIKDHPLLMRYEKYENDKVYYIMELDIL
jgi:ribosomal protein S18 acetylase RimI-like enzyme